MPASSIGPRAEAVVPQTSVSRSPTATNPVAKKATPGSPSGVLSSLTSRPKRTGMQPNESRLDTRQRLNDSKLPDHAGDREKPARIAKATEAPAFAEEREASVIAEGIAADETIELMNSVSASLKEVEGIGSKITDTDADAGYAQQAGNLLRSLALDLAGRTTAGRIENLEAESDARRAPSTLSGSQ